MNWYENAVMYHIYPLGFCGAPKFNEGGEPVNRLEKVLDWIPHLKELGVFAVSGARIGMEAGFADNMFLTTFLGATTAIGGGMLRDVLLREMPFVLKKRVYAVAAILGALGYALLLRAGVGEIMAYGLGMIITTAVRILATVFKWNLPKAI